MSEQRTTSLAAAAQGAAQRAFALFQSAARNLLKSAEGLDPEQGVRLNAILRRCERLGGEAKQLADDIGTLAPSLTSPRTETAA